MHTLLLFILFSLSIQAGSENSKHYTIENANADNKTPSITINLYNSSQSTADSINNVSASSESNSFSQAVNRIIPDSAKQSVHSLAAQFGANWQWYMLGGSYSILAGTLIRDNYFFQDNAHWMHWKKFLSIEELQLIPHHELTQELLHTIHLKNVNQKNPTDSISPLIKFAQQIEEEKYHITRYLGLTSLIKKCWLSKLFPFNDEKIERVKEFKKRIEFIEHIFISWAAAHNLNQVKN